MAKRRNYEQKLYDDLEGLAPNTWFNIIGRTDYDKLVEAVKIFIDCGEPYEFSDGYKKLRKMSDLLPGLPVWRKMKVLPEGYRIEKISPGFRETCTVKHKGIESTIPIVHEHTSYRVYDGDKLIAIET